MQSGIATSMEIVRDYILIRRPAVPRWWDSISQPHVAIILEDSGMNGRTRYYISQCGPLDLKGREPLEVADLDAIAADMPDGTLLEVRFNAQKANLYKLEVLDGVPCWRWVGKSRGLNGFEYPCTINWHSLLIMDALTVSNGIAA
ncbi:MAG: hypothetical protein ACXADL_06370 [Candidatus Thorarchaeota archaeon]|jgi:hypothetical protein